MKLTPEEMLVAIKYRDKLIEACNLGGLDFVLGDKTLHYKDGGFIIPRDPARESVVE